MMNLDNVQSHLLYHIITWNKRVGTTAGCGWFFVRRFFYRAGKVAMKIISSILFPFLCWAILGFYDTARAGEAILFLGDSITAGYGVEKEQAFPSLIESMLKEKGYGDIRVMNAGISGSTSASALSRLKWYGRIKPRILFLALGANDGLRGLSTEKMEENMGKALALAKNRGMKVILAGMEVPPNYGPEYSEAFRRVFRTLAEKHRVTFMPFLLKGVGGIESLNLADGIHPNAEGHRIIATNVLPHILKNL